VADNMHIVYLPAYSPELNPVERLWQYMKSNILKNKIYETIDDLKKVVVVLLKTSRKRHFRVSAVLIIRLFIFGNWY